MRSCDTFRTTARKQRTVTVYLSVSRFQKIPPGLIENLGKRRRLLSLIVNAEAVVWILSKVVSVLQEFESVTASRY